MKQHKAVPAKQGGFSLIEIMVVLAIAGLILAGVAWSINKSFNSNDIKDTSTALTTVMSSVPELRTTTGYGAAGTDLMPALIAQNSIPSVWPVVSGVPQNAWGGTVAVTSGVTFANIVLTKVPQEACNKLATRLSQGTNFASTKIGSGTAIVGEVSATQAQTQCTADNTITWTTTS